MRRYVILGAAVLIVSASLAGCGVSAQPVVKSDPVHSTPPAEPAGLPVDGGVVAGTFESEALGREMAYGIYLPPGYDDGVKYPVLYLYDGYGGNETNWFDVLNIDDRATELIDSGEIEPLLIVTADVEDSYGINSSLGDFEDYVAYDVISEIDQRYSTIPDRTGRYIGGLSMGGFIALHTAFTHPDVFSRVGGHSAALWTDDWSQVGGLESFLYPDEDARMSRDPLLLAQTAEIGGLSVWLDCGAEDGFKLFDGAQQLTTTLTGRGVAVQYTTYPGAHEAPYWEAHAADYLRFYSGLLD